MNGKREGGVILGCRLTNIRSGLEKGVRNKIEQIIIKKSNFKINTRRPPLIGSSLGIGVERTDEKH